MAITKFLEVLICVWDNQTDWLVFSGAFRNCNPDLQKNHDQNALD